ncbi:hypothetical protein PQQ63_15200 [Paraburkholderia metrosideri]|uniref:Uncharacterized protein n=1 Tax=Paraburkholderia metrosideri TaxID=580937 RepID=A0ABW9DTP3_9BURK
MSEIKQTPLVADAERVRLEDGTLIATVWEQYPSDDRLASESWMQMRERTEPLRELAKKEAIDSARRFAAAPELLEALLYALPYLEACVPNPRNGVNADYSVDVNCVDRARAAIAKATGSQS